LNNCFLQVKIYHLFHSHDLDNDLNDVDLTKNRENMS